jgi:hypothetical protein
MVVALAVDEADVEENVIRAFRSQFIQDLRSARTKQGKSPRSIDSLTTTGHQKEKLLLATTNRGSGKATKSTTGLEP